MKNTPITYVLLAVVAAVLGIGFSIRLYNDTHIPTVAEKANVVCHDCLSSSTKAPTFSSPAEALVFGPAASGPAPGPHVPTFVDLFGAYLTGQNIAPGQGVPNNNPLGVMTGAS